MPASLGEEATRDPEADERLPHPTSFVDVPAVERVLQRAAEVVVVPLEPIPKSTILAMPCAVMRIFAGLMSRWTIERRCAASSLSAICCVMPNVSASGSGPRAIRARRDSSP